MTDQWTLNRRNFAGHWQGCGHWFERDGSGPLDLHCPSRQIDPTTCERDYNQEEIEFMQARDDYKRQSGRMFPTCSEILEVIRGLGYQKVDPAEASLEVAEGLIQQAIEDEGTEQFTDDEEDAFAFEDKEENFFDN